jgi:hypothetical protein
VQLLWGLWNQYSKRKQEGQELDVIVDSQGTKTTSHLQHIIDSYSRWLHSLDFFHTPQNDDPDATANTADSDGSDKDEDHMEPIFPHDNTVPRGTLEFFQEQVKGMQVLPGPACGPVLLTQRVSVILSRTVLPRLTKPLRFTISTFTRQSPSGPNTVS